MYAMKAEQERNEPQGLSAGFKGTRIPGDKGPKAGNGTMGNETGKEGQAIELGSAGVLAHSNTPWQFPVREI